MPALDDYIFDVLMRDLIGHDRKPAAFLVYLWLVAEQARRRTEVRVSYEEIAEAIGISKTSAQTGVKWLARRKLIAVRKENVTAAPRYRVLSPWRERGPALPRQRTS
jgi:hypothetical protein